MVFFIGPARTGNLTHARLYSELSSSNPLDKRPDIDDLYAVEVFEVSEVGVAGDEGDA